jgi:glycerophosphoryl diester phosphodiesterase
MPAGLAITHEGFTTRLKWHRLRRSWADPLFSADVMAAGFALGASMELDLRVRKDGGFLVLHDEELEGETTGYGLIAETTNVNGLTMLEGGGPVLTSEAMAQMLAAAHPEALLQFDMKDDLAAVGDAGVEHLQRYFGGDLPCSIIVSGASLELIVAVREKLPNLLRGIDPTDKLVEIYKADGLKAVEADLLADLRGPTAPDTVYLHWRLVLNAEKEGLDMIGLCHSEGRKVDAWTFTLKQPAAGFSDEEWTNFSRLIALRADQITTDEAPSTEAAWLARV